MVNLVTKMHSIFGALGEPQTLSEALGLRHPSETSQWIAKITSVFIDIHEGGRRKAPLDSRRRAFCSQLALTIPSMHSFPFRKETSYILSISCLTHNIKIRSLYIQIRGCTLRTFVFIKLFLRKSQ